MVDHSFRHKYSKSLLKFGNSPTSLPFLYAQSNGMAERNVQTAKNIFKKVFEERKDMYLALLHYRNMLIFENFSPSQILMSRKLRSTIPTSDKELLPKIIDRGKFNKLLRENIIYIVYIYGKIQNNDITTKKE